MCINRRLLMELQNLILFLGSHPRHLNVLTPEERVEWPEIVGDAIAFLGPIRDRARQAKILNVPRREEITRLWLEAGLSEEAIEERLFRLRPLSIHGDLMTIEGFIEASNSGDLSEKGFARFALWDQASGRLCNVSATNLEEVGWTHVEWCEP